MWQLNLQTADEMLKEIGAAIIGNIDDDGILVASLDEIAALGDWDVALVEKALEHVQTFDPIGVGARDPQECLLLQVRHLGLGGTPVEVLVRDHLRSLQNQKIPELARQLGLETEEIKAHIELIKHLDPKPGSRYSPNESQYVIPDVYIIRTDDGYKATLNEDGLPQLRISPVYRRLLDKGGETSDETRAYVKDKFRSALWLLKSVDQRQKTIIKVATSIITFQREFLDRGIEHLKPLVLRDVASDIGMHESTVSRVVNNKYMHTPQGVYELKYFFHSGISSSYGEIVSSVTIKQRIKKIIEAEDQRRPLSDSKIMNMLQKEGLVLARRTIAEAIPGGAEDSDLQSAEGSLLTRGATGVSVGSLLGARGSTSGLDLDLLGGAAGLERRISLPHIQKTGLALAGFDEYLRAGRVLIFGESEIKFPRPSGRQTAPPNASAALRA